MRRKDGMKAGRPKDRAKRGRKGRRVGYKKHQIDI